MSLEMKVGDIINVKGKGIISRAIRLFSKGPYSHCGCYLGDGQVIDSDWGGVQLKHIDDYDNYDVFRYKCADKRDLQFATDWMKTQIGSKYDYKGLFGIAKSIIFKKEHNDWDNKDRYWCSELIADGFNQTMLHTDFCLDTCKVSPNDFAKSNWFYQVEE